MSLETSSVTVQYPFGCQQGPPVPVANLIRYHSTLDTRVSLGSLVLSLFLVGAPG